MKRGIFAAVVATLLTVAAARADTISITSGTVELEFGSGATTAVLLAADTDIVGTGTNPASIAFPAGDVDRFSPNGKLDIGQTTPSSEQRINAVTYPPADRLQGSMSLTTSPFHADLQTGALAFFHAPFSMTGTVSVFEPGGTLLRTTSLEGTGTASILARLVPNSTTYTTQHISYQFGATAAAPTPEPASIALLGVALGGGWLGRRVFGRRGAPLSGAARRSRPR